MADNQDPLAALQKLLAEQKNATSQSGQSNNSAGDVVPNVEAENAQQPVALEENKGPTAEEIAVLEKAKAEEDQIKIEEQLQKMETELQESPQYQARMSQKQANEAESEQKRLEERSKRIFQLKHLEDK